MQDPRVMAMVRQAIDMFARMLDEALTSRADALRRRHTETDAERSTNEAAAEALESASWAALDARRNFLEETKP